MGVSTTGRSSCRVDRARRSDVVELPIVARCDVHPQPIADGAHVVPFHGTEIGEAHVLRRVSAAMPVLTSGASSIGFSSEPTVMPVRSSRIPPA